MCDLHDQLEVYQRNPEACFLRDAPVLFNMPAETSLENLLDFITPDEQQQTLGIVSSIAREMLETTKLQLQDFLPGGHYHNVQDPDVLQRLQLSQLTNLLARPALTTWTSL